MLAAAPITHIIPIRTLSTLTGVRTVTLRAWERRYGLLKPARTLKGHRLYSQQDVDLVKEILAHLEQGIPISQVKFLLKQKKAVQNKQTITWPEYQNRMFIALKQYSTQLLEEIYNELLSLYPIDIIIDQLIRPLLDQVETSYKASECSSTQRSFFLFYLRNKLAADLQYRQRSVNGPSLVVTCSREKKAEINMLLFSLAATEQQYQIMILGVDITLTEISKMITQTNAAGIVLINNKISEELLQNLNVIAEKIYTPIFIEAEFTQNNQEALVKLGVFPLARNRKLAWKQIANKLNR